MKKHEFNPDYEDDPKVLHGVIKDQGKSISNLMAENEKLRKLIFNATLILHNSGLLVKKTGE